MIKGLSLALLLVAVLIFVARTHLVDLISLTLAKRRFRADRQEYCRFALDRACHFFFQGNPKRSLFWLNGLINIPDFDDPSPEHRMFGSMIVAFHSLALICVHPGNPIAESLAINAINRCADNPTAHFARGFALMHGPITMNGRNALQYLDHAMNLFVDQGRSITDLHSNWMLYINHPSSSRWFIEQHCNCIEAIKRIDELENGVDGRP